MVTIQLPIANEDGMAALIMCRDTEMPAVPRVGESINSREVQSVSWSESIRNPEQWVASVRVEPMSARSWEKCKETAADLRRGGWEELSDRAHRIQVELGMEA